MSRSIAAEPRPGPLQKRLTLIVAAVVAGVEERVPALAVQVMDVGPALAQKWGKRGRGRGVTEQAGQQTRVVMRGENRVRHTLI